jgi:uncharacterized protein YcaQ
MTLQKLPHPQISITKSEARRFMLMHHGLWPPRNHHGKRGVIEFISQIGSIQFDPINIVGRNPDLVLQSRISDYQARYLDELLYTERTLIDGWDKMACIYPSSDWPFFTYRRKYLRDHPDLRTPSQDTLNRTIDQIQKSGPLSSLDFKEQQKVDWHWGPTKPVRAAMEYLYSRGYLGIHHRVNNRRYFDLIENLLPFDLLNGPDPHDSAEIYRKWHVLRRVGSLGIAQFNTGECWGGIIGVGAKERRNIILQLIQQNQLMPVSITGLGETKMVIRNTDLPTLESARSNENPPRSAAFIAPLDNLLWNRKLIEDIFDFKYRWEIYKPKEKREYGYYVLPVLYGDRLVARIEPTYDKTNRTLEIQNWWWEPGVTQSKDMLAAQIECISTFLKYLNAEEMRISDPIRNDQSLKWLNKLM